MCHLALLEELGALTLWVGRVGTKETLWIYSIFVTYSFHPRPLKGL